MVHRDKILCFLVLFCCFFAHTPLQAQQPRKKVGLVLGGGGAKGAAEVGVLKVLEEADIPVDYIAGTSIGAIVTSAPAEQTLKVAAIETAYGSDMWKEVCAAFEAANPGVTVELTTDKKLEDVIGPSMKAGDYPDVIHLATGREAALTETFIKDNGILDITGVLDMTVPGEDVKVKDKIA